ncbi:MAG: polymerase [Rickettsiaceae bacterium]|jgi:DNA polymerase-1|nr:polymerase [Rickettsiaceae bacterium]
MSNAAIMPENKSAHKLILIDGYGFVFRAYHALSKQRLTRADGTPVGAVYAFTNMLLKIINDHETDYIAVVFDAGRKTFRNDIYPEYKAHRPPAPDDLIPQFPLVREAAKALNLAIIEKEGFEADDLIATYTRIGRNQGLGVCIISSDKDLMQLVGEGVEMYDPLKSRKIGVAEVQEKFGVTPDKVLDVLSLMGDSSDNIPGVPGIGPKTAAELINQFGGLDEVLASTAQIKQQKRREVLEKNAENARISRQLASLCFEAPVDFEIKELEVKQKDGETFIAFLQEQGFKSLVAKFHKSPQAVQASSPVAQVSAGELISEINNLKQWTDKLEEIENFSIYTEYDEKLKRVNAIAFRAKGKSCYFPFKVVAPVQASLFADGQPEQNAIGINEVLLCLKDVLEDKSVLKIGYDIKGLIKSAKKLGINVQPIDDVMIMSYSLDSGLHRHELGSIVGEEEMLVTQENAMSIACKNCTAILDLHKSLKQRLLAEKCVTTYEKIEKPLINVLADMELAGIKLEPSRLRGLSETFTIEVKKLEVEIFALAGSEFNIGSPKQLGEILFEKLSLNTGKKSKATGAYSTDAKVLQGLTDEGHIIAEKILEWRHLSKMMSTYTETLPKQVAADGRVHTTFAMAATTTGRLSSHDPNLQNIPIRTEAGNKIREAFVAEEGCKLISADYSQIELRLLAHVANIAPLQEAFRKDIDIHAATASQMFGIPVEQVDSEFRRKAKMINFGIIYGISAFGLAQRLNIPRGEAADYIAKYFQQYPGIEAYMKETIEFARKHNYVQTVSGRRCYVNGINDRNPAMRQFSERAAINAPLQGTAADIIKKAMVVLADRLQSEGFKSRILLQVHDELLIESPEPEVDVVKAMVKKVMEGVVSLSVPVTVDVGVGNNWREIH